MSAGTAELQELVRLVAPAQGSPLDQVTPRIPSRSRWPGVVATFHGLGHWFRGQQPAAWLAARRGVLVDVVQLETPADLRRLELQPLGVRWLLDGHAASALPTDFVDRVHGAGGTVVISVDDHPLVAPAVARPVMAPALTKLRELLLRRLIAADAVLVASPFMADVVTRLNPAVIVIPPAIPAACDLPAVRLVRPGRARRVGWAGTYSHLHDLELLREPILGWLDREAEGVFVLAGQCFPTWTEGHPRIERHPGVVPLPAYYAWLTTFDLDIFVVPLLATAFNAAKACLKPTEASTLGLPCIVSDVPPYAGVLTEDTGHVMVKNTTAAWFDALTEMVNDAELRADFAARGRAWAAQHTIAATGPAWATLWGAA